MSVTFLQNPYTSMKNKTMELEIIKGFIKGDTKAIEWIYQQYAPSVYGHVIKNNGSHNDASDIFQITMLEVRQNLLNEKYKHQNKFKHYFVKIAMNIWRNEQREREKKRTDNIDKHLYHVEDESNQNLERVIVKNQKIDVLYRALKMLDTTCRELINTHYFDAVRLVDIAKERNEKPSKVRVTMMRCRDKVKKLVNPISNI